MIVKVVPKYILPFGYGLTLYKIILIRKDGDYKTLYRHEATHSMQWVEAGFFKFMFLYTLELLKNGYQNNKYEIEARESEKVPFIKSEL